MSNNKKKIIIGVSFLVVLIIVNIFSFKLIKEKLGELFDKEIEIKTKQLEAIKENLQKFEEKV